MCAGIAIAFMFVLVFVFVRNINAAFWNIQSLFSIGVGTIGYLQLWGIQIDGVSMISILLAVGVSVDCTAHICYHFYTHDAEKYGNNKSELTEQEYVERLVEQLLDMYRAAGWPVLQVLFSFYVESLSHCTLYLVSKTAKYYCGITCEKCWLLLC